MFTAFARFVHYFPKKGVFGVSGTLFKSLHQFACPDEFGSKNCKAHHYDNQTGPRSDEHYYAEQYNGETDHDLDEPPRLMDCLYEGL